MNANSIFFICGLIVWLCLLQSCRHDSFIMEELPLEPMDTMSTQIDTMLVDTMDMNTTGNNNPCDPDIIYFQYDILPILQASCAISGCHDAATASDQIILDNFENVISTAEVVPFDLSDSKLYKVITENDSDEIMPPDGKMENEKISLIAQWILQGALDLDCDYVPAVCDTMNVTYSSFVAGLFDTSCNACHSSSAAFGGVILDNYDAVKLVVESNKLLGSMNWDEGFEPMPQGQEQLDSCAIANVKSWIDEGAPNN